MAAPIPESSPFDGENTVALILDLKPEHVTALLSMIDTRPHEKMAGESFLLSWILDTGASLGPTLLLWMLH